jgi:hypothetical protein
MGPKTRGECEPDRLGDRVITEAADSNVWHNLGFEPPLWAATAPTPIMGKNPSTKWNFLFGPTFSPRLKEQTNREKTKVATMGLERCGRRPQKGAATD